MSVYVEDQGQGEPVVLAHAGVADSRIWDLAVPVLLEAGYRVIRYDLPGYGRSGAPEKPYSLVHLARQVLDDAGVDSVHWVGLSQGGATGADLAIADPARIRTLSLVAPGLSGYDWPARPPYDGPLEARSVALHVLRRWGPMSFTAAGEVIDEPAAKILMDQVSVFMAEEDFELEEPSALDHLGEIAAPTLIVLGDRDEETITDIGRLYAKGVPGAASIMLAGADHLLPLRVPEQLHPLLLAHFASPGQDLPS